MQRCPNSATGISSGRLNEDLPKRRVGPNPSIGHRIHAAASSQRQRFHRMPGVATVEHVEKCLLIHGLGGTGHIVVEGRQRRPFFTRRPQELQKRIGIDPIRARRTGIPLILHRLPMVTEKIQIEREATSLLQAHNLTHPIEIPGFTVWGQPHHLVFVPVMGKTKKLGQGQIEEPQGVWKKDPPFYI